MTIGFELVGLKQLNAKIDRLAPAVRERLVTFMLDFVPKVGGQVKANILERFGSAGPLYQSVRAENVSAGNDVAGRVYTEGVPYAAIQEHGGRTPPHVIEAINGRVLAFMAPGRMGFSSGGGSNGLVFAKKVNHPGSNIPERSYARLALVQMRAPFEGGIREVVNSGIADAMRED